MHTRDSAALLILSLASTSAFSAATLAPRRALCPACGPSTRAPALVSRTSSAAASRGASDGRGDDAEQRRRRLKREMLFVKGVAGAALLRLAYSSFPLFLTALVGFGVLIISPVIAVEAILLAVLLCSVGIASYWPANLAVFALGTAGTGGCVHGCITFLGDRQRRNRRAAGSGGGRRRTSSSRQRRSLLTDGDDAGSAARRDEVADVPEDGSGGLVALTLTALTAAIVGALP